MPDRLVPREVLPEVDLLLRVPEALGELVDELVRDLADLRVQLVAGDDPVHEAPVERLGGGDPLAQVQHLPRAAVADDQRQPLGCAPRRDPTALDPAPPEGPVPPP